MVDIKKIFGKNLRKYRVEKHISQEKLAEMAGLGPKSLSPVENGHKFINVNKIEKICEVLDIEPYQLFINNDEKIISINIQCSNPDSLDKISDAIKKIYE